MEIRFGSLFGSFVGYGGFFDDDFGRGSDFSDLLSGELKEFIEMWVCKWNIKIKRVYFKLVV